MFVNCSGVTIKLDLTYKALNGSGPSNNSGLLSLMCTPKQQQSAEVLKLGGFCFKQKEADHRVFLAVAPWGWSSFPSTIHIVCKGVCCEIPSFTSGGESLKEDWRGKVCFGGSKGFFMLFLIYWTVCCKLLCGYLYECKQINNGLVPKDFYRPMAEEMEDYTWKKVFV